MAKKNIQIIDDEHGTLQTWKESLEAIPGLVNSFDVACLDDGNFRTCLNTLESRRSAARKKKPYGGLDTRLDSADVLIVDYDLLGFDDLAGVPTGERVAYLARCYSRCDVIVGLNQFGRNTFDLTLRGHLVESFADLNVGGGQVSNENLWVDDSRGGFHPWHWPNLAKLSEAFRLRFNYILDGRLDTSVMEELGFTLDNIGTLPRTTAGLLVASPDPAKVKFREVVSQRPLGKAEQDEFLDEEAMARIAAARVYKWLERAVRPGQDILIDAPHLVARFPSLLTGDPEDPTVWNRTTDRNPENIPINFELLEPYRFKDLWADRPLWFWNKLKDNNAIEEIKNPFSTTPSTKLVFCEDISYFLPVESTRGFVADVTSPFVRRFVVNQKVAREWSRFTEAVDYTPAVRLAM